MSKYWSYWSLPFCSKILSSARSLVFVPSDTQTIISNYSNLEISENSTLQNESNCYFEILNWIIYQSQGMLMHDYEYQIKIKIETLCRGWVNLEKVNIVDEHSCYENTSSETRITFSSYQWPIVVFFYNESVYETHLEIYFQIWNYVGALCSLKIIINKNSTFL